MGFTLLKLRVIQIRRELQKLGLLYIAFIFLFIISAIFITHSFYKHPDTALYIPAIIVASITLLHISRRDREFIFKHVKEPYLNILSEYIAAASPFIFLCLLTRQWYYYPLTILSIALIAPINLIFTKRTAIPNLTKLIPAKHFEWVSGARKSYIFLSLCLLMAFCTSWLKLFPLIPLWLFTSIAISFYQECEPLNILFVNARTSKQVVISKIKNHSVMLMLLFAPILFINSCFNPEMVWINLIFLLVELSLLAFAILLKYSTYSPNERLTGNNILISFACIGTLIPFLLPIPLIMSLRNYSRAINNLNTYFYDQR